MEEEVLLGWALTRMWLYGLNRAPKMPVSEPQEPVTVTLHEEAFEDVMMPGTWTWGHYPGYLGRSL